MKVITIARKPSAGTVAQNGIRWGTGGINIDAGRIGVEKRVYRGSGVSPQKIVNHGPGDTGIGMLDGRGRDLFFEVKGRWPANVILQHRPECQNLGIRKIQGNRRDTRPEGDGGRQDKSQWRMRPTEVTRRGYAGKDGLEETCEWDCSPGCSVAALDAQSGPRGGFAPVRGTEPSSPHCNVYGERRRVPSIFYGDVGGAARFFKQVKE